MVAHAKAKWAELHRPIILADTQDNPGAGGNSDTTGLLESLVRGYPLEYARAWQTVWRQRVAIRAFRRGWQCAH